MNKRSGRITYRQSYYLAIVVLVPAALLICCEAYRGYRKVFLQRYLKAVTFSIVTTVLLPVFTMILNSMDHGGLSSVGVVIIQMIIWLVAIVALFCVWERRLRAFLTREKNSGTTLSNKKDFCFCGVTNMA